MGRDCISLILVFVFQCQLQLSIRAADDSGVLDPSFKPILGADASVNVFLVQPDGKTLVGGAFTNMNGRACDSLARLNLDGSLDGQFNSGSGTPYLAVNALALQSDGRIIVGGTFTSIHGVSRRHIARLNSDGSVDRTFDLGSGISGPIFSQAVYAIAIQSDGKIVIGGIFDTVNTVARNSIVRLNNDGTVDSSFEPGSGAANILDFGHAPPPGSGAVYGVALQSDGKIILAGRFGIINGVVANGLSRLNGDGSLDSSFQMNAWIGTQRPPNGYQASLQFVAIQDDGKILFGGDFCGVHITRRNGIERLNADGTLDPTFAVGVGMNCGAFPFPAVAAVLEQSGKILLAATAMADFNGVPRNRIARLNSNGSLDPLNPMTNLRGRVFAVAIQSDGNIRVGGSFTNINSSPRTHLARFLPARLADPPVVTEYPASRTVVMGADAAFRVVATSASAPTYQWQFNGQDLRGETNSVLELKGIQFRQTGRYAVRVASNNSSVTSLEATLSVSPGDAGGADPSFNPVLGGSVTAMATQPDSRILLGGYFQTVNGVTRRSLARLLRDGRTDLSFDPGSGLEPDDRQNTDISAIAALENGRILVGGRFKRSIVRLLTDGAVDASFTASVTGTNLTSSAINPVTAIAIQSDGRILVGGSFEQINGASRKFLARLHPDGTVDSSFGIGEGPDAEVTQIRVLAGGKILVAGFFAQVNRISRHQVARLNADGTVDPDFTQTSNLCCLNAIALQADGKLIVAGGFTNSSGGVVSGVSSVQRFQSNGAIDSSFRPPALRADNGFHSMIVQSDGKVVVAGRFITVDSMIDTAGIFRLNSDGSLDRAFNLGPIVSGPPGATHPAVMAPFDEQSVLVGGFNYVARVFLYPQTPPLLDSRRVGASFQASIPTLKGRTDRIETTESLHANDWRLFSSVPGDGLMINVTDAEAKGPQRFYRLRVE